MAISRRGRWVHSWEAWVGEKERLLRLAGVMDDLIDSHRRRALAAVDETERGALRRAKEKGDFDIEGPFIRKNFESDRKRLSAEWTVEMVVRERDLSLTHTGPPDQIVNELDPPFAERLSIRAPRSANLPIQATVHFSQEEGCSVELRGNDPAWLRTARDTLGAELERGVPNWAWLRTYWASALSAATLYLAFAIAIWDRFKVEGSEGQASPLAKFALLLVLGLICALILGGLLTTIVRQYILGFEIIPPGATPRSRRVLGLIGSLVAALLIGVAVNLITK